MSGKIINKVIILTYFYLLFIIIINITCNLSNFAQNCLSNSMVYIFFQINNNNNINTISYHRTEETMDQLPPFFFNV